jgi:hypothetical protein
MPATISFSEPVIVFYAMRRSFSRMWDFWLKDLRDRGEEDRTWAKCDRGELQAWMPVQIFYPKSFPLHKTGVF